MGFIADLFKSPKVPKASQLTAADQAAQGKAIQQSQAGSLINQNMPGMSINYSPDGIDPATGLPRYTGTQSYSPENQFLFNTLLGTRGGIGSGLQNLVGDIQGSLSEAPDLSMQAGSLTRDAVNRMLDYKNPYFNQLRQTKDTELRNQGLTPGTPAYDFAMMEAEDNISRNVSQDINTFQPEAFKQALQQYQTPLNTIQQLMGFTTPVTAQSLQTPTFTANAANASGNMMSQYNAELAQRNAAWGGLAGLAGGFLGAPVGTLGWNAASGLSNMMGFGPLSTGRA